MSAPTKNPINKFTNWISNLWKQFKDEPSQNQNADKLLSEIMSEENPIVEPIIKEDIIINQKSKEMTTNQSDRKEKEYLTLKKTHRTFEEIGLLFGLTNNEKEKNTYLQAINKDINNTRSNLKSDINALKEQLDELLSSTKSIRQELRSLINDFDNTRSDNVTKLHKAIMAVLPSDFSPQEKKEIISKVLDEGVGAISSVKESIIQSHKTIDEMIRTFFVSSPISQIQDLYHQYLEELKTQQKDTVQLQKGFAAGLAINKNLEQVNDNQNDSDE